MLRQAERHRQHRMQQPEHRPAESGNQQSNPQIGTIINRQPADHRAKRHDALDAEVEHTRAFGNQRAECGKDQRRGDTQHGSPETGRGEDVEKRAHRRILYCVKNTATSMDSSDSATVTSAI
ncbi:hypothetical protein D3C73_1156470 [compost metagenome]